eukprot:gene14710-16239_t
MSKMTRLSYSRAAARAVDQRRLVDDVDGRVEAINVLERSGMLKDTGRRPTTILVRASQVSVGNKDILDVLSARGFKTRCIQQTQNRDYLVTLDSAASKKNLIELGSLTVNGAMLNLTDPSVRTTFISIYYAPFEMHMDALRFRLREYGEVLGLRRNKVQGTDTYNGLVTAQLLLLKHVPSYIQIGTHSIMFRYAGQPRTCRRCDGAGHEAQGCQRYKCHNCGKIGHHKDCEEDIGEEDPVVPVNDDSQPCQDSLGSSIWGDDVPVVDVEDSSTSDVVAPATKRPPSVSQSTSQIVQATESEQHEGNPQRPQYLTRSSSGPSNTSAIPKPHQSHCSPKPMDGNDTAKRVLEESETESVVSRGANTKTKVKKKVKNLLQTAKKRLYDLDIIRISGARIRSKELAAEILKHISHLLGLFSSDETDDGCQRFLLDSICLSLPDDVRDTLEVPISSEECTSALKA